MWETVKRYRSGSCGGVSHPITSVPLVKPDKDSSALWETGREEDSLITTENKIRQAADQNADA